MEKNTKNIIIGLAAIGVGGYIFYRMSKKKAAAEIGTRVGEIGDTIDEQGSGGSGSGGSGGVVIVSQEEITRQKRIANTLFTAMNGCGTDWGAVTKGINEVKNENDWQGIIKQYGNRTISSEWWCVGNSDYSGGLIGALKSELSDNYFSSEVDDINEILKSKNVTTLL